MGMAEVFEAKIASSANSGSIRPYNSALTFGFSTTASITRSQPANSASSVVAFNSGANLSIRCGSEALVWLLYDTSSRIFCTPPASAGAAASVSVTGISRLTTADEMPEPMMPAPNTPTALISRGLAARFSTPGSFLLRSVRKKTLISARLTGVPNTPAKPSASICPAASASSPAEPSSTSSAASGAG